MTTVLHLVDAGCDGTCLQVLAGLAGRRGNEEPRHVVCALNGVAGDAARAWLKRPVEVVPARSAGGVRWSSRLGEVARNCAADVVHSWSVISATTAVLYLSRHPLVLSLLDPMASVGAARWLQSLPVQIGVIAGNQVVKARLARHGIEPSRVAVIRSEVDFKAINGARASGVRGRLVGDGGPVLLLPVTPRDAGESYAALWAAAVIRQIYPNVRLLAPGGGKGRAALARGAEQIRMAEMVCLPPSNTSWPDLVASADILFAPVSDDVCTEPIAWGMAAGLPIVATAVRSVAEYIADRHNGLLFKPRDHKAMARRLLHALEDVDLVRRLAEVARGQAYEIFSRRVFLENYRRVYDNLLGGRPIQEDVSDTLVVCDSIPS